MEDYKLDKESINEVIEWLNNRTLPKELRLNESEYIHDVTRYVKSNISDIEVHYPDTFYAPAIIRLYRLREKLEKETGV